MLDKTQLANQRAYTNRTRLSVLGLMGAVMENNIFPYMN